LQTSFAALIKTLNGDGQPRSYQLNVANALWKEKTSGFVSDFLETTKRAYGAGVNELDFKTDADNSRVTINHWVEQQTQDKIKDLLSAGSIKSDTRLVLTNAIYFKGTWANEFDKKETANADFMVTKERKVSVPFMQQEVRFKYMEVADYQALELPYA
jgi:serpin B